MRYAVYGGHGSWAVAAVFLLTIALRLARGNRRRSGQRPRPPVSAPGFHAARPAAPGDLVTSQRPASERPASERPEPAPDRPASGEPAPERARPVPTPRAGAIGSSGIPAGWLADPTGRHELRYWSGTGWTEHVSDGGVPGTDTPPKA